MILAALFPKLACSTRPSFQRDHGLRLTLARMPMPQAFRMTGGYMASLLPFSMAAML